MYTSVVYPGRAPTVWNYCSYLYINYLMQPDSYLILLTKENVLCEMIWRWETYGIFYSFEIKGSSSYFYMSFCHRRHVAWKNNKLSQLRSFYFTELISWSVSAKIFSSFHLLSWKSVVAKPLSSFLFVCKWEQYCFFETIWISFPALVDKEPRKDQISARIQSEKQLQYMNCSKIKTSPYL